jgi:hypothetical protein
MGTAPAKGACVLFRGQTQSGKDRGPKNQNATSRGANVTILPCFIAAQEYIKRGNAILGESPARLSGI